MKSGVERAVFDYGFLVLNNKQQITCKALDNDGAISYTYNLVKTL